jgi:MFS family permease
MGEMELTAQEAIHLLNPHRFTVRFGLLCILHCLFANAFHLFGFVSVIYMQQIYHYSAGKAAWISSISSVGGIFLCPLAGWLVDRIGYKMYICFAAGILTSIAFGLLALVDSYYVPVISMLLLSICISFVPTVLRSSVPNLVNPALYGTAYGMYEVSEAAGNVAGNWLVGVVRDATGSYLFDLYAFTAMGIAASVLSAIISSLDSRKGGVLNKPSHKADPHHEIRSEKSIGFALTGMYSHILYLAVLYCNCHRNE